jgi:uncharacterized protein (TIGR00369 family)
VSSEQAVPEAAALPDFSGLRAPFVDLLGMEIESLALDEVVASLDLDPERHMQPYGIVHGGVYASLAETVASIGAALNAAGQGRQAVGLENHTSFIRAVREGTIRAVARPLHQGRTVALWEVEMREVGDGRVVAKSTVRLALPEPRA